MIKIEMLFGAIRGREGIKQTNFHGVSRPWKLVRCGMAVNRSVRTVLARCRL